MLKATWNGATIAESDNCVVVEGNQYFPSDSVNKEYLKGSQGPRKAGPYRCLLTTSPRPCYLIFIS
jgi:uncharacterized protein (DUF427 family)